MLKNLKLLLYTHTQYFENWLERYRLRSLPVFFRLPEEKIIYVLSLPTFKDEVLGVRRHEIEAGLTQPMAGHAEQIEVLARFPVIEIRLFQISDDRLQIQIDCRQYDAVTYCLNLLEELQRTWPEAMTQQDAYAALLAVELDKNPKAREIFDQPLLDIPIQGKVMQKSEWLVLLSDKPKGYRGRVRNGNSHRPHLSAEQKWNKFSERTQKRFLTIWEHYLVMMKDYQRDMEEGKTKIGKPNARELMDRLNAKTKIRLRERRLREVIALGEAGVIKVKRRKD